MKKFCAKCGTATILLLASFPWIFLGHLPERQQDVSAYDTSLSIYLGIVALFGILACFPNRWMGLRVFAWSLFVCVAGLLIVDRLPPVQAATSHALIFQPGATAVYRSSEFSFTAHANNFGFRDRDFQQTRGPGHRVLAIGNSFTYGWGVDVAQSWPKVLEKALGDRGVSVEVANLGQPGANIFQYADVAERAIPLMQPDLVVLGIFQGSDLSLSDRRFAQTGFRRFVSRPLVSLFPNVSNALEQWTHPPRMQDVHQPWVDQSRWILAHMDAAQRSRYQKLDDAVRGVFAAGALNPSMIWDAMGDPAHYRAFTVDEPAVQAQIATMAEELRRVRRAAEKQHARVAVVSLPFAGFVNRPGLAGLRRVGFVLDDSMLRLDAADQAISRACADAGVAFFPGTPIFRERIDDPTLYFPLDGHFAAGGHLLCGMAFAPFVERLLAGR